MNRARGLGHGKHCVYDGSLDRAAKEKLAIERELPLAIGTDELFMVYQPIYGFDRDTIVGFEALMRWNSSKLGNVSPAKFIPIAESEGLLQPIEKMVARPPLHAAASWPTDISISINASAIEFKDRAFAEKVRASLARAGIDSKRLIVEVTESAMIEDDEVALSVMREVKALGVKFALDDFGTGYASLSYLHRFPFDRLKIDMSLVRELNSPSAVVIVEAALAIAYRFGIEVVAEGVEFDWQFEKLRGLGCHYIQGYLIGKPMPEEEVHSFLAGFGPRS